MIGDAGGGLDDPADDPLDGSFHFLIMKVVLTKNMQEVVCQKAHLQPSLIGLKSMTTGLVPAQGVLSLFYPILDIGSAVIDCDHLLRRQV